MKTYGTFDQTTNEEQQLIRTLAWELDGVRIADEYIPQQSLAAQNMAKSLQRRLDRKRTTGIRSSLAQCYERAA